MSAEELEKQFLGDVKVGFGDRGSFQMTASSSFSSRSEAQDLLATLETRKSLSHPNLLSLVKIETQEEKFWCSASFTVRAIYEFHPKSLKKEISFRRKNRQVFSAVELMRIAIDCVAGFGFLQSKGVRHGEIHPSLVFLASEDGENRAKICERFTGYADRQLNILASLASGADLYLDPLIFEELASNPRPVKIEFPFKFAHQERCLLFWDVSSGGWAA